MSFKSDWQALGLQDHSPFAILQQIRQAPFVNPENRTLTAAEKQSKKRETNRIHMQGVRLKEKALRVNLFSDSGTAKQYRAAREKNRGIAGKSVILGSDA